MEKEQGIILPIIIVVIVVALLGTAGYFAYKQYSAPKSVACTEEAKVCPDGSAVGRTGPNCEFAECPAVPDQTAGWKTYKNNEYGFEVKSPNETKISVSDVLGGSTIIGKSIIFQIDPDKKRIFEVQVINKTYQNNGYNIFPRCSTTSGATPSNLKIDGVDFIIYDASKKFSSGNLPYAVAFEYCTVVGGVEYNLIPIIYYYSDANGNHVLPDIDADVILNQMISTFKFTPVK